MQRYTFFGLLSVLQQDYRFYYQQAICFRIKQLNPLFKRLFDILFSGIALMCLSPIFAAVALLIVIDSPGPVFFFQNRVGKRGKLFKMWKFRSMCVDAEKRKAELLRKNEMKGGVIFKMKNDPRITRVGRFIRKFSIDELPQFWNVFIGDMSIVGPRPPIPYEVAEYTPYQWQRLEAKPGITCIWQVEGRPKMTPFNEQVEQDLEYIATQSFYRDIELIVRTVPAVLKGSGF